MEPDREREQEQSAQAAAARERFVKLVRGPEEKIDLAEAALLIAAEEYPGLDVPAYLARLDDLAARVRRYVRVPPPEIDARDRDDVAMAALHRVLFVEERLEGDPIEERYHPLYHPQNSYLNQVLDRKRGMPITLSLIYIEVARRAGLNAVGLSLPNHFMAEFRGEGMSVLIDAYNRGTRISAEDRARLPQDLFVPATKKQILARMLNNLKNAYRMRGPLPKALAAVERILVVAPSVDQVRDRGLILAQMSLLGPAWFDLKLYARLAPDAADAKATADTADQLWKQLGRLN